MNDNYKIPVPKFLVKELTFWGLPYNLAVLMGGVMVLSAIVLKSIPIFIIFFIHRKHFGNYVLFPFRKL